MKSGTVRTRFAPSPTGFLHVGGLRTALYAYLIAKAEGGQFLLRIEDTDQERYVEGATEVIYDTLRETGLQWDEGPDVGGPVGPYIQSERKGMYLDSALELVEKGEAYYCFCDKERLEAVRESQKDSGFLGYDGHCRDLSPQEVKDKLEAGVPYVIRQRMPREGSTSYHDMVFGDIEIENAALEDQVLIKTDGMPTYNFANVVDDNAMGITHIVRGSEYLSSTPKYNLLYKAFGWEIPTYVHVSPVMKNAQEKLSKRHGDATYQDLTSKGYLSGAILNYIALLGWSPRGENAEKEIFTLEELLREFDIGGISKSPAIFDNAKLRHINAEWIRALSPEEFHQAALPWMSQTLTRTDVDTAFVAAQLHARCEVLEDIPAQVDFFDSLPDYSNELYRNKKMKTDEATSLEALKAIEPVLAGLDQWTTEAIHDALFALIGEMGVKNGWILWPLRVAVSGKPTTPGGGIEIAYLLGKEDALARIRTGIAKLS